MFGTSKKLKFTIEDERKVPCYIIMPSSRMRMVWNLIVFFLLMYTATLVPYRTIFIEDDEKGFIFYFDIIVDILYTTDLVLNFFMAYEDADKKLETRLRYIAVNYFKSWFFLDFLSCIPFQYVEIDTSGGEGEFGNLGKILKLPRMYKMIKILRLFKLVRLMKYSRSIKKILQAFKMNQGIKRMITVTITMLFLVHLMGCLFFLVASFEEEEVTWVQRSGLTYESPAR